MNRFESEKNTRSSEFSIAQMSHENYVMCESVRVFVWINNNFFSILALPVLRYDFIKNHLSEGFSVLCCFI